MVMENGAIRYTTHDLLSVCYFNGLVLYCTISEIKRDIGRNFSYPLVFNVPYSPRRNIAVSFGVKKIELRDYPKVKKVWWYV